MKYLQLYDHLGNLVKEFEIYVDGQDFSWAAPKPEPVWLGTIRLVAEKAAGEVEPTPEPKPTEAKAIAIVEEVVADRRAIIEAIKSAELTDEEAEVQPQAPFITPEPTTEKQPEVPEGYMDKMLNCLRCNWKGKRSEAIFGHDDYCCPECNAGTLVKIKEVKREPKKRSHKSRGAKGTSPSTSPKRPKTVS